MALERHPTPERLEAMVTQSWTKDDEAHLRRRVTRVRDGGVDYGETRAARLAAREGEEEEAPLEPTLRDLAYEALVERGELQQISPDDERRLREKVGRIP